MSGRAVRDGEVLVACAHGTRDERGRRAVAALVEAVAQAAPPQVEVVPAFVDVQQPSPDDVVAGLGGRPAVLVPLLLSAGYHVQVDLRRAAGRGRAVVAAPLGPDEELAGVLAQRLAEQELPDGADVRLVAAGSSREAARLDVERTAAVLAAHGVSPEPAYLSASPPLLADVVAANRAAGRPTVALGHLLAPGHFADRLARAGADVVTRPLLVPGEPVPQGLVRLVLRRHAQARALLGA